MNLKLGRRLHGALVTACVCAGLLAACGGGGGGGGGSSNQPPPPTGTGLLPAAVLPGASLADDASAWRPLRDKSVYTYRGRHSIQGGTEPDSFYEDVVTQVAQGGGVIENATNAYNEGPDAGSPPVILQAGALTQQLPFQFAQGGTSLMLDFVELRSPIRTNDRYVVTDRRIADIGVDVDGDKKNDGLDLAVWVQVMGDEVLDLPNRKAVRTIRTEATIRARIVPSSGVNAPAAADVRLTIWYAAGVGPVKVKRDTPHPSNDQLRVIDEETLVTYDGITDGIGGSASATMSSTTAGTAIPLAYDAVGFDSHAVAISNLPNAFPVSGFMLTQLDSRGAVMAATAYPVSELAESVYDARLLRMGNELRLIYVGGGGISMLRFSADGRTLKARSPTILVAGSVSNLPYTGSSSRFRAAATTDALWLATEPYVDSSTVSQSRLELRRFDAEGNQVGAPTVLESGDTAYRLASFDMATSARHVVMTWYRTAPVAGPRHRVVDATTGQLMPVAPPDLGAACQTQGLPLALDAQDLLACGPDATSIVPLGTDGMPLTTAAGGIRNDALLPADWPTSQGGVSWVKDVQRLSFFGRRFEKFWPEDGLESSFFQFAEVPIGASGPDIASYRSLARIPNRTLQPQFAFALGNRVLVIGTDCVCQTGGLGTMIVWR